MPVAFLAIAYFTAIGVWYGFVGEIQPRWKPLKWLPIAIVTAGIYTSLFFASLMVMGRTPWCAGCALVHLINLLLAISVGMSRWFASNAAGPSPAAVLNHRQSVAVIAMAILLISVGYSTRDRQLLLQNEVVDLQPYQRIIESLQTNSKVLMDAYLGEPAQSINLRPDEVEAGAQHQLVIFLDFQCPACLITSQFVRDEIVKDFGSQLNIVVRHYPLCTACNPKLPKTIHPAACAAAYLSEAARLMGGRAAFDRMSDLLFANQVFLDRGIERALATQAGLDPERLMKLLDDPAVEKRVSEDVEEGHALNVTNTPTLFLDGRLVPQICMAPAFWNEIARRPATGASSD